MLPPLQNASDGVDVWESMSTGTPSPRQEILLNLIPTGCQREDNNCTIGGQLALRQGPWKLLLGHTSVWGENSRTPSSLCAIRSNQVKVERVGLRDNALRSPLSPCPSHRYSTRH